jgi:hypothetical protein
MPAMEVRRDATERTWGLLVGLVVTAVETCAIFVSAFCLYVWALGVAPSPGSMSTSVDVRASCEATTLAQELQGVPWCALAVFWHLQKTIARILAVSFCLCVIVLRHDFPDDDCPWLWNKRGSALHDTPPAPRPALEQTRIRPARHPTRSPAARETTAEQVRNMAPGTARPTLLVLPDRGAVSHRIIRANFAQRTAGMNLSRHGDGRLGGRGT